MAIEYVALATSPSGDGRTQADLPVYKEPLFSRSRRWPVPAFLYRVKYIYFIPLILLPIAYHVVFNLATPYFSNDPLSQGTGDNPYFSTGDVWEHNNAVATRLENCANLGILRNTSLPLDTLSESEEAELIEQGCGTNQTTVVILSSLWFAEAFAGTSTAGEAIYAQSVISTLNAYNYSYVFSSLGWYNNDMRKTVELWRQHKWNVRMVLSDPEQIDVCYKDEGQECLKTKTNPEGIESWRLLSFWYWDDVKNPLGAQFTLSPSPRNDNYFLSYSIEPTCRRLPFVPPPQRPHPPQAYLLAKQVKYFSDESGKFAWTLKFLSHIKTSLGISLVAGMNNDDEDLALKVKEAGIENFGRLSKIDFYQKLSQSFVFIGVGQPRISPSPWDALCMGVPFINPILQWDENDPSNRTSWHAQQWHMTDVEPPYVYHVHAHDLDQLRKTIQHARATPIGSYIPEYMRFEFVRDRAVELLQRDWRAVAEGIMRERVKSGGEVYEL